MLNHNNGIGYFSLILINIAKGLKEHRKSESYKIFKKTMKKLDKNPDLSYLKGHFSKD